MDDRFKRFKIIYEQRGVGGAASYGLHLQILLDQNTGFQYLVAYQQNSDRFSITPLLDNRKKPTTNISTLADF